MARFKGIRKDVQYMVDALYELHDSTDPRKGEESEHSKLYRAQRAISIWWFIYARLMQWAQSHIIGYELARLNPECQEILRQLRGKELNDDSHELELLGSMYAANRPEHCGNAGPDWYDADALADELEKRKIHLDDETLRRVIVRLLLSTSADSSVWRFPLSHALRALNSGEVDDFVKPSRRKRRGKPYQLDGAKADAIKYVHYLVGKGVKKHVAQAKVGNAVGQSVETLRSWEKELQKDDWFRFMWETAAIAGHIEESTDDSVEELPVSSYDGRWTNVEIAADVLRELKDETHLPKIKERLRKYHK